MTGAATLSVYRTLCVCSARVDSSTHVLMAAMGPLDLRLDFHVHDSRYTVGPRISGPLLSGSFAIRKKIAGYRFTAYGMHTYSMCVRLSGSLAYPDIFLWKTDMCGYVWYDCIAIWDELHSERKAKSSCSIMHLAYLGSHDNRGIMADQGEPQTQYA